MYAGEGGVVSPGIQARGPRTDFFPSLLQSSELPYQIFKHSSELKVSPIHESSLTVGTTVS